MAAIDFYFEGDEFFAVLEAALAGARESIDIELYYFADDRTGLRFADLLAGKAAEGVRVRLIYDAIGCRWTGEDLFLSLDHAGVAVKAFHPLLALGAHLTRRTHRKFFVVDGRLAFLGGYNLADEYSRAVSGEKAWRDTGVRLDDPDLSGRLERLFEETWRDVRRRPRDLLRRRPRRADWTKKRAEIIPNYGWQKRSLIRQEYLAAIVHARRTFWVTNPYFVPDVGIRRALRRAARRGVDVRILTAGESDVPLARWAGEAIYSGLLKAGVRIFEYQKRILHAKSAVSDGGWYTVGTANLDHMSFFRNHEVNLFASEAAGAAVLEEQFRKDLGDAREIALEVWRRRSWLRKLREKIFFWLRVWL